MTDGAFSNRLAQLKTRWESDPTSRVFLQLAEEYRHQGRIKEALVVLDQGLHEHPGYLSALVAKGRCHLELGEGEAAKSVLERVVKQDATQMVANKLLVRAYLETGEPDRARERLDLYSLLNDSDPEISDLRRQIKLMDRAKEQAFEESQPSSHAAPDDVFDLGGLGRKAAFRPEEEDVFHLSEPATVEEHAEEPEEDSNGDLFPGMVSRASRERYLAGLAAEGIFEVGPTSTLPSEVPLPAAPEPFPVPQLEPPAIASEPVLEDDSWLEEIAPVPQTIAEEPPAQAYAAAAAVEVEEAAPAIAEPAELWPEEEAAPEPESVAGPTATATLGELYLRQGHRDEAERIFREVLEREPGNAAARAGLHKLEEDGHPRPRAATLGAHGLLMGFRSGPGGGGTTARKVYLLTRYLDRLRGSRNVP